MSLYSGDWWSRDLDLGELGRLTCAKATIGEAWLWKFEAFRLLSNSDTEARCHVVLQGMRKSERGAKRNAIIETQRYLGGKLKLLGKVKP